jgi:cullin-associated NEDD8-dissociated protein 1
MVPTLLPPLHAGLSDDAEIRLLALLSLHKAVEAHAAATRPLLPSFVDAFKKLMAATQSEHALRQETDRLDEGKRGAVRLALEVQRRYPDGVGTEWADWWANVRSEHATLVRAVEEEGRADR